MRILQVVHQYMPEYIGGTELHTRWLAEGLSQSGHSVGIFYRTSHERIGLTHRIDDYDIRVWTASTGEVTPTKRFLATFSDSSLLKLFQQTVSEMQPDVVHIQHLMGLPVSIVHFLQQEKIPYVITLHDYWWVCANAQLLTNYDQTICDGPGQGYINCAKCVLVRGGKPNFGLVMPPIMGVLSWRNKLLRGILNNASVVITPSNFVSNWYLKKGKLQQRPRTIPHGIPLPDNLPKRDAKKREGIRYGYIGGISPQKGVHIAIEAFSGVGNNAELWIAGDESADPDYSARLHKIASDGVLFLGELPRVEVWDFLAKIDVLLVPSLWYETFAFVVSEAFAMGVPVITSDIGALSDRVQRNVDGLLTPSGNTVAIRQTLQRFLDEPDLLSHLQQGIQPIRTIENHTADVVSVYKVVLTADS